MGHRLLGCQIRFLGLLESNIIFKLRQLMSYGARKFTPACLWLLYFDPSL